MLKVSTSLKSPMTPPNLPRKVLLICTAVAAKPLGHLYRSDVSKMKLGKALDTPERGAEKQTLSPSPLMPPTQLDNRQNGPLGRPRQPSESAETDRLPSHPGNVHSEGSSHVRCGIHQYQVWTPTLPRCTSGPHCQQPLGNFVRILDGYRRISGFSFVTSHSRLRWLLLVKLQSSGAESTVA